jgi:tRNA(Ile)-lysidine synthase
MDPAIAVTRTAVRRCLADVTAGDLVLVAVSGGADSLALAAAAAVEAPHAGLRAGAVTVDHGLQPGSAKRASDVAKVAAQLGLEPVLVRRVEVASGPGAGGPEAGARAARYAALDAAAAAVGATRALLGHTLDDQAETVLLGLARGSGARSLAGMPARRGIYLRPFLGIRRAQTAAACVAQGLTAWEDPHNRDPAYTRSRVRASALPALVEALGAGVPEALARTADLLRADADALDEWAAQVADPTSTKVLADLPPAVRGRVIRALAIGAGATADAMTAARVEEVDRLVTAWHGQGPISLPGGLVAERRCDRLHFQ